MNALKDSDHVIPFRHKFEIICVLRKVGASKLQIMVVIGIPSTESTRYDNICLIKIFQTMAEFIGIYTYILC
jgi:hypothetical protein